MAVQHIVHLKQKEPTMIEFHLKDVLSKLSMSMSELSKVTGISRTSLSQLATGKSRGIQFNTLEKIVLATKCSISDLIVFKPHIRNMVTINSIDDSKKIIECKAFNPDLQTDPDYTKTIKINYQTYQQGIIFHLSNENNKKVNEIFIKFLEDNNMIDLKKINHLDIGEEAKEMESLLDNMDLSKKETFHELNKISNDFSKKISSINISNQVYELFSKQFLVQLICNCNMADFNYSRYSVYIFNWENIVDDKRFKEKYGETFVDTTTVSAQDIGDYYLSNL